MTIYLFTKYKVKNPVGKILLPKPQNFVSDIFWPDSKRDVGINYAFRSDRAAPQNTSNIPSSMRRWKSKIMIIKSINLENRTKSPYQYY